MNTKDENDQKVLAAVRKCESPVRFCDIQAEAHFGGYRDLDRHLQSMRRRGLIRYNSRTGWTETPTGLLP